MKKLGVNVGRVGSFTPEEIAATGCSWVRCTFHIEAPHRESMNWAAELAARGIKLLMVLDNDAHYWERQSQWADGVARAQEMYGDDVDWWQVCNEPDAGWNPAEPKSAAERSAEHPSSWCMDPVMLTGYLREARRVLGPDAFIIGPGMCSGHPQWAMQVIWEPVDAIAVHPYAKEPGSRDLDFMLSRYQTLGLPVWATEYDARTVGMHAWMSQSGALAQAAVYCYSDVQNPGFGLVGTDGLMKETGERFQVVNLAASTALDAQNGGPPPMPETAPNVGPGILAMMAEDGTKPAQRSSTWLPLGVTPSDVEECYGENGTRYVWLLKTGAGLRFPPDRAA